LSLLGLCMDAMLDQALNVLIIDDSCDDAFALERAIKRAGFHARCQRVESANQLQSALEHEV